MQPMGEIRLTFETRDFGAISQVLIDRGISFRVEPMMGAEGEPVRASHAAGGEPRRPAKAAAKGAKSRRGQASGQRAEAASGADRLREAIARNLSSVAPGVPAESPKPTEEE
jgi:hypothetical protein